MKTRNQKLLNYIDKLNRGQLERNLRNTVKENSFLRDILDTMTESVVAVDKNEKIVYANSSVYDFTGISAEEAVGNPLSKCLRDESLRTVVVDVSHNTYISFEVNVKYPRVLTLMVQTIPLSAQSKIISKEQHPVYLLLLRDISHEKNLLKIKARESRLESVRLLTAGVAHEIGNPLSAIILHSQLMDRMLKQAGKNRETDELDRINHVIHEESLRLKRIISDFLNAVRPLSLTLKKRKISDIIEETFELMYSELSDKGIAVIKDLEDVPETLVDSDQFRGVLINIIKNAADSMPDGGTLKAVLKSDGDSLKITFKDDGEGIDKEHLKHVFEPFYTTKADGSGLGLLLVQRILNAHEGSVKVKSLPGKGTTVILELPIRLNAVKKSLPLL